MVCPGKGCWQVLLKKAKKARKSVSRERDLCFSRARQCKERIKVK